MVTAARKSACRVDGELAQCRSGGSTPLVSLAAVKRLGDAARRVWQCAWRGVVVGMDRRDREVVCAELLVSYTTLHSTPYTRTLSISLSAGPPHQERSSALLVL